MLFVLSHTNDLVALEAESGKIVWSKRMLRKRTQSRRQAEKPS
jgi:glucose dehydrogenase